jgi:hypothetical protein
MPSESRDGIGGHKDDEEEHTTKTNSIVDVGVKRAKQIRQKWAVGREGINNYC